MTGASFALLGVAAVLAVLDWVAVARGSKTLEYVAKPGATAAILATAVALEVARDAPWVWLLFALVFCLFGDVFLMLPRDAFVPGLASFAVAQILFAIGFVSADPAVGRLVLGAAVVAPVALVLARRFVGAIRRARRPDLVVPVVVYLVVISVMAVTAIAAGSSLAILGALTFMLSDALIAESRFVKRRNWHGVGIMVTYHFALVGLVLGLA